MAKYVANLAFVAQVEIEAQDAEAARVAAEHILDTHSVYADMTVQKLYDEAHCAGDTGRNLPMCPRRKRAFEFMNTDFVPDKITLKAKGRP